MSVPTAKLIQTLQELAQAASGFRKTAFSKAVEAVKKHKKATITKAELAAYQGIGEGILRRFDELVSSGGLAELKEHEEERKVVELFEGIYGVGPVLAKKWFQQGYRTLKDIPVETLTRSQSLGLKYYKDINSRIPRHEIDQINRELSRVVSAFNSKHKLNIRAKICGSYLRGRESSGDIDIIISDVSMPIMTGPEMLEEAEPAMIGNAKVLFLSGYAPESFSDMLEKYPVHYLSKPVTMEQLVGRVKELLAAA